MINTVTEAVKTQETTKISILGRHNGSRVANLVNDPESVIELHETMSSFVAASTYAHLLMVDCTEIDNLRLCRRFISNGTPIIVIIDSRYDGWQQPYELNITGYLSVNTSDNEIAARLAAMLRCTINKKKSERFREVPRSADTS